MISYKVLLVSPFPPPFGGIASYSDNLYEGIVKKGIFVRKYNTAKYEKFRFHNPDRKRNYLRVLDPRNFIFFGAVVFDWVLFAFEIIRFRPDIVHVHTSSFWGWWRSIIYISVARIFGKKTLLHIHNAIDRFYFQESGKTARFFIRASLKIAHRHIALSDGIKDLVSKLTSKPVTSIYNGVHCRVFENDKQYSSPLSVLFVGFVGSQKGVPDLLRAVRLSGLRAHEIRLTVVGAGDTAEMKGLAAELGLDGQVVFTGRVGEDEKISFFKSHHVLALPSYGEGQPISILEGMAAGMAILSTSVGSIPEIVKNGENGFLVRPGEIEGLSRAMIKLTDEVFLEKIGYANKKIAQEKFNFSRVIADNILVYGKIMGLTGTDT